MYENNFFVAKQNFSWKRDNWASIRHGIYLNNIRVYETFLLYEEWEPRRLGSAEYEEVMFTAY